MTCPHRKLQRVLFRHGWALVFQQGVRGLFLNPTYRNSVHRNVAREVHTVSSFSSLAAAGCRGMAFGPRQLDAEPAISAGYRNCSRRKWLAGERLAVNLSPKVAPKLSIYFTLLLLTYLASGLRTVTQRSRRESPNDGLCLRITG